VRKVVNKRLQEGRQCSKAAGFQRHYWHFSRRSSRLNLNATSLYTVACVLIMKIAVKPFGQRHIHYIRDIRICFVKTKLVPHCPSGKFVAICEHNYGT
jgi:hypothetical protein